MKRKCAQGRGEALLKFHEAIKDALDPNSIMAPGKSGIWGKKYRGQRL
jgi:4-cresol dehydrogenase (hydroxylating)